MTAPARPTRVPPYGPDFDDARTEVETVVADHLRGLARALAGLYALYRGPEHGTEVDRHVYRQQLAELRRGAEFGLAVAFDLAADDAKNPWGRR